MDPFNDNVSDTEEQDPAADFIAQEQRELAGLDDDFVPNGNGDANYADQNDYFGNENQNSYGVNAANANGPRASPSVFEVPKIRPSTPEKIRKWREDQKTLLEKKDVEEDRKKQELRMQAQRELEDWYQQQEDAVKKAKKGNRDTEREFLQQRDSDKPGEEWERIARLCDFNPKSAKGTKDVSRLRSIILQLKQLPAA